MILKEGMHNGMEFNGFLLLFGKNQQIYYETYEEMPDFAKALGHFNFLQALCYNIQSNDKESKEMFEDWKKQFFKLAKGNEKELANEIKWVKETNYDLEQKKLRRKIIRN